MIKLILAAIIGVLPAATVQAFPDPHPQSRPTPPAARRSPATQARPSGVRVSVDRSRVSVDDGDTLLIRWDEKDQEDVRILGIDSPETRHLEHEIPYAQSFGEEARAFALGALAAANRVEILRAATVDPYGRTLAYVFLDGQNYSTMVIAARLAEETISQFGNNGFPKEAADVSAAAKAAGPMAFESPSRYRARMRELSRWLTARGRYPK